MNELDWRDLATSQVAVLQEMQRKGRTLTDLAHAEAVLMDGRDIYAETVTALGFDPRARKVALVR